MHESRGLRAVVLAAIALLALAPAAGVEATATARSASSRAAATAPGYDISWRQCGGPYPVSPTFGIVGVNKGIVFSSNPCLGSEVTWAGATRAALYANTANPGPALSTHWPTGQTSPQVCSATNPDSTQCAYDYGYNAAADSYADAVSAFAALGLSASPAGSPWWLDVETANSWRSDVTLNVAALSGAVYYLGGVARIGSLGFYSTSYQWRVITGGTSAFSTYSSWVAEGADVAGASANCAGPGFTGGGVTLAQYPSGGFDADLRCSTATPVPTPPTVTAPSVDFLVGVAIGTSSNPVPLTVTFTATDPSGIASTRLQHKVGSGSYANVPLSPVNATTATVSVGTSTKKFQQFRARATDGATPGNTSPFVACTPFKVEVFQDGSKKVKQGGKWSTDKNSNFYGRTVRQSSKAGRTEKLTLKATDFAIVATKGKNRGIAEVFVDGVLTATIDLYSKTTQYRQVVYAVSFATLAKHTITFQVMGTKNAKSKGKLVDFDAFLAMAA